MMCKVLTLSAIALFQYRERSHRERERDRNRFFRENHLRNMMYQRQNQQQHHQQQQQQHRDNFNDNNYDSSESDSDSEAEMEENNDAEPDNHDNAMNEDDALMMGGRPNMVGNENNLVDNDLDDVAGRPHNGILERIDYLSDRRNDGLLLQNDENLLDDPRPPVGFDENSRSNFDLLGEGSGSRSKLNLGINPPINDESSRESMDIDYDGGVELGEINVSSEKILGGSGNVGGENIDSDEAASSGGLNNYFSSADNGFDSFMRASTSAGHHSSSPADVHTNCKCIKCDDPLASTSSSSLTKTTKEPTSVSAVLADARIESCCADSNVVTNCCCTKKSTEENSKSLDGHTCDAKQCDDEDVPMGVAQIPDDDEDDDDKQSHHLGATFANKPTSSESFSGARTATSTAAMRPEDKCDCGGIADEDIDDTALSGRAPPPLSKDCSCFAGSTSNKDFGKDLTKDCDGTPPSATDKDNCEECSLRQQPNADASAISDNAVVDAAAAAPNAEPAAASAKKLAADERRSRDDETARPNKKAKMNNGTAASRNKTPRTIFHKALDAVGMSWENQHLKQILASNAYAGESFSVPSTSKVAVSLPPVTPSSMKANFNTSGEPLWHEPLAMCAARIDSLRSHGHTDAALRLSVSVVRTMKQIQRDAQVLWHRYQTLVIAQQQNSLDEPSSDPHCCCECRKKKTDIGSDALSGLRTRSGFPTDGYNKMYRYDYGHPKYSNFGAEGCKRCMETRDRVGYNSHLPGTFNASRFGVDAGASSSRCMPPVAAPPMLNNGFGSMGNNVYDQRFGGGSSSRFGSTSGYNARYDGGNGNYGPASGYHHSNSCHASNCNIVHRNSSSSSLNMVGDSFFYNPRIHCNGFNRCPAQERKVPTIAPPLDNPDQAGPSTSQAIMPKGCTNVQNCDCKRSFQCSGSLPCNVDQIAAAAAQPPPPPPPPPPPLPQCDGPSTSAAATAKQWSIPLPQQPTSAEPSTSNKGCGDTSKSCSKHTKNQCCIKKYCCKVPVAADKYNCCASINTSSSLRKDYSGFTGGNVCDGGKRMPNGNIFFGRNNYETCPRRANDEQYNGSCSAHLKMATGSSSSSRANVNNIVNYGASTSKAAAVSAEFVRNKKPGCISNCLDCCVGCEIEFPLDAVACIFDCLTEACIIPDSINGPNMGRLSFDSVTGATEDGCIIPPRYQHVLVPVSNDRNETYLTLAFEVS